MIRLIFNSNSLQTGLIAGALLLLANASTIAQVTAEKRDDAQKPAPAPAVSDEVTALRDVMDRWMQVQKSFAQEKRTAREAAELLKQRIELVSQELAEIERKKIESEVGITEADKKKAELVDQRDRVKQSLAELEVAVPELEMELQKLLPLLPEPLKEKLGPLYQRIAEAFNQAKITLAERCQNIVGILNEINKANQEINLVSEVRTMQDGKPTEVKTLYVGLAQAYYINATGKKAGIGKPGPNGWTWTENDSLAPQIKTAIEMLQSKSTAQFVSVPAELIQ